MTKPDLDPTDLTRRRILRMALTLPVLGLVRCSSGSVASEVMGASAASASPSPGASPSAVPTASCVDSDEPTVSETEGPYFKPSSPLRSNLIESGLVGSRLTLTGRVLSTACRPVANALLDFWQADGNGNYDNSGFRLRGHQLTNANGEFALETVVPGLYPGRTRHIHVKVQAPSASVLTTQLYVPGETRNGSDSLYRADLEMGVSGAAGAQQATFTFVVRA